MEEISKTRPERLMEVNKELEVYGVARAVKLKPFIPHALRRFYTKGFEETDAHRRWPGLWRKQFKLRLYDGALISLNKFRSRFSFQNLSSPAWCLRLVFRIGGGVMPRKNSTRPPYLLLISSSV
jgi:hypothetical protein